MEKREQDRRVQQTRGAIIDAFNGLVLERPHQSIHVGDIVADAGVGRSTFYEHFRNTDEVLAESATELLAILADAVTERADLTRIRHFLEHMRENRAAVKAMLSGSAGAQLTRVTGDLIRERLTERCAATGRALIIPAHLAAAQIAEGMLAVVRWWIEGPEACTSAALAEGIVRTSRGAAEALLKA